MSQIITPPDYVDSDDLSILLVDTDPNSIEMVISACRVLNKDYNIYLCGRGTDPMWLSTAIGKSSKVFMSASYEEIVNYLKEQDAR